MSDDNTGTLGTQEQELPSHVQDGIKDTQPPVVPPKQEQEVPQEPEKVPAKETDKEPEHKPAAESYVATSIQYLSAELGVSDDDFDAVYENAIKHGDVGLINPQALGKELTPEQTTRVTQLAQLAVQEHNQQIQRVKDEIYSVAGSEAAWKSTVQAFNANASQDEQEYAAYLADTGKLKQAATYITKFANDGGFITKEGQAPLEGGNGSPRQGLSSAEYKSELGKLERERGNRSFESPALAAKLNDLNARRTLGRQQGL